jgi:hypothetical protein
LLQEPVQAAPVVRHAEVAVVAAVTRVVGAILLEPSDEWAVQRSRYMTLESIAPLSDDALVNRMAALVEEACRHCLSSSRAGNSTV